MAEKEQAKPLAPSLFQSHIDIEEEAALSTKLKLCPRKYINCCGCFTAFLLILGVTILILFCTVFHVKDPFVNIDKITLLGLRLSNNRTLQSDSNMNLIVDVSLKNPNVASFKFNNSTTAVLYRGEVVGEAITPSGKAKARRTIHMNVTVKLIPEKLLSVPSFLIDLSSGSLTMNSNTVIGGKVKIMKIIKKFITVEVNCTITYNLSNPDQIQQDCRPHFI